MRLGAARTKSGEKSKSIAAKNVMRLPGMKRKAKKKKNQKKKLNPERRE